MNPLCLMFFWMFINPCYKQEKIMEHGPITETFQEWHTCLKWLWGFFVGFIFNETRNEVNVIKCSNIIQYLFFSWKLTMTCNWINEVQILLTFDKCVLASITLRASFRILLVIFWWEVFKIHRPYCSFLFLF